MGKLDGKVALVTGAARGQGRAHATTLAREGADVVAVDIAAQIATVDYPMASQDDLAETVKLVEGIGRRAIGIQADVRSQAQLDDAVARAIAELGHVDILIANAGIHSLAPFWEMSEEMWDDMIDVNLTGVWKSAKAVAPHMIERGSGSIVMTASVKAFEPGANYAHYVAAKRGLVGLMGTVALELAPYGIRCNAVCPGAIDTGMTDWQGMYDMMAGRAGGTREDRERGGRRFHALKGHGFMPPEMVANAALWLVSDEASAITGVSVPVDGGHLLLPGFNHNPVE
ncbi:mycofactocin-coupled SDR family oxidoreductase [Dactylosporangium sp. CA-233914]|uniref:mycofactocin-coupled SDR family oxidoreductase n=1 Tax=Dactylosporangium sp. CA-233914 TaxID=3239934 RepID=UPI003D8BF95F